jgi:hypothetical protein
VKSKVVVSTIRKNNKCETRSNNKHDNERSNKHDEENNRKCKEGNNKVNAHYTHPKRADESPF